MKKEAPKETPTEAAIIMEEMQSAQKAPEPGTAGLRENLSEGVEGFEGKPRIKWLSSAGYTYVWDNRTGERSTINNNMLSTQLKKKRPDGSRIFTTIDPKIPVVSGNLKCLLHANNPDRKKYEHIVFTFCRKENLRNPYQVRRHMEKRHKDEWEAIKEENARIEKAEDREIKLAMLEATKK